MREKEIHTKKRGAVKPIKRTPRGGNTRAGVL